MNSFASSAMRSPNQLLLALTITGMSAIGLNLVLSPAVMGSQGLAKAANPIHLDGMIAQQATTTSIGRSLGAGATGAKVKELQQRLKEKGFDPGSLDSTFGPSTKAAVVAFQRSKGLQADGVAGPQTLAALGIKLSPVSASTSTTRRSTASKISQSAKSTSGSPAKTPGQAINVLTPEPTAVAERFYWSGAKGNLGLSLVGKFTASEKILDTFNLSRVIGVFDGKQWTLKDVLVSVDFNVTGNAVNWKVSGPRPVLERYLASLKAGYQDRSLLYEFSFSEVNFKPTPVSQANH